jgi:Mitochondrial biogenesis AIM24
MAKMSLGGQQAGYAHHSPQASDAKAPAASQAPPNLPGYGDGAQTFNANAAGAMPGGAPSAAHFTNQTNVDDVGSFNGGAYRISHRDTNSVLTVQLAIGAPVHAKPGAMIAMSPSVTLKGEIKFSMKKLVTGSHMSMSTFTGPGELLLAPGMIGDISSVRLSGVERWTVGKDAFLACTDRIVKDHKATSISKAMFSGEGWFNYKISGSGILWISSFGAIIRKDVSGSSSFVVLY